jgi:hypothetical protein
LSGVPALGGHERVAVVSLRRLNLPKMPPPDSGQTVA